MDLIPSFGVRPSPRAKDTHYIPDDVRKGQDLRSIVHLIFYSKSDLYLDREVEQDILT